MSNFWILLGDKSNKENYRQINFFVLRHRILEFPSSEVQTQNESTNVSFRWWIICQNLLDLKHLIGINLDIIITAYIMSSPNIIELLITFETLKF